MARWTRGQRGRNVAIAMGFWVTVIASNLVAAVLKPESLQAWSAYLAATEARRAREEADPQRFLALDFASNRDSTRRAALAGAVPIEEVTAVDAAGHGIDMPSALVHDWRGVIFVPGCSLDRLLAGLEAAVPPQADVLRAEIEHRDGDTLTVFLRIRRAKVVTVVYDTEHLVRFVRLGPTRAVSATAATRITEMADPGTSHERPLEGDDDHGYLWRWNTYWRYEELPGGVLAECESVSLSRSVPAVVGLLVAPLVNGVARESMARSLEAVRTAYASPR